jgi:AAA+ ATPase superfamily predicted ATPase
MLPPAGEGYLALMATRMHNSSCQIDNLIFGSYKMTYKFPQLADFLNRSQELTALEDWWASDRELPVLILFGRRRTGKSWLFRRFAHGKRALIFVCERRAASSQLALFAQELEAEIKVLPALRTFTDFYRALYRLSENEKRLVVIDEFPELFARNTRPDSELATTLEDAPHRNLRLLLCGSHIGAMQEMLGPRAPMHGRGRPLRLLPLPFDQAREFLSHHGGIQLIERYAIAGGMPHYLQLFNQRSGLRQLVSRLLLNADGPLFNEPRTVLDMELTDSPIYFTILETLANHSDLPWSDLINESRIESSVVSRYLHVLQELSLVEPLTPINASHMARAARYRVKDHLMRFWFRFIFRYQDALTSGLAAEAHFDRAIAPQLNHFIAPTFESICRAWILRNYGREISRAGSWWGPARHDLRRTGQRTSEQVDVVGGDDGRAVVVAECKWQSKPMSVEVLRDLHNFKIPALAQAGLRVAQSQICLFSRSGFSQELVEAARVEGARLVSIDEMTSGR